MLWAAGLLARVSLQLGQIIKGISAVQLTSVNEAHEEVPHPSAVLGLIEERILAMQNGFLQAPFAKVIVQWDPGLLEEKREFGPVFL